MTTNQSINDLAPWERVTQAHKFSNDDEKFWWMATAPSFGKLLANSSYSSEDQLGHLEWYHKYILTALGPRPLPDKKALFEPCPVSDGSAVEPSINWKEKGSERLVRFTIEAVGYEAGTSSDPFNQNASVRLMKRLHQDYPAIDLHNFDIFAKELFLGPETKDILQHKTPPGTPLSQIWMAFDLLHGGEVMAKIYFMPILKWILTGIPTKTLVFNTIRQCGEKFGSFEPSIQVLDAYLCDFPSERAPVIEMVAIDCVDSPKARIKCYLRTGANTLAKAKLQFTLGGRLTGAAIEPGLDALGKLWPLLFRLPRNDSLEDTEVFPAGSYCGCAVEMKPGAQCPETKLHIPVRKIPGSDAQLCDALAAWFEQRGHSRFAQEYKQELSDAL